MNDLGLDLARVLTWFPHKSEVPYVLVRVSAEHASTWPALLGVAVRRCYINDSVLRENAATRSVAQSEIIAAKLPDPGAIMAGDFGEIVVYLYQGAREHPNVAYGATKWRLKQDRRKPAPHSDVVHFVLPSWPNPSEDDLVLCSEVKTKSTNASSTPITSAIEDSKKDRASRLARTLVWLRERALTEDLGDVELAHLERFINATEHPPAKWRFRAVAVISEELLDAELTSVPTQIHSDCTLVVISVPNLHEIYGLVFTAALAAVAPVSDSGNSSPTVVDVPDVGSAE